jgi:hypothetical protein
MAIRRITARFRGCGTRLRGAALSSYAPSGELAPDGRGSHAVLHGCNAVGWRF